MTIYNHGEGFSTENPAKATNVMDKASQAPQSIEPFKDVVGLSCFTLDMNAYSTDGAYVARGQVEAVVAPELLRWRRHPSLALDALQEWDGPGEAQSNRVNEAVDGFLVRDAAKSLQNPWRCGSRTSFEVRGPPP